MKAQIVGAEVMEMKDQSGRKETKLVLNLDVSGEDRKLSLNKSNLQTLIAGFGDDTDLWIGKFIAVYFDPSVTFGGKQTGGVRVKVPGQKTKAELALEAQRAAQAALADYDDTPTAADAPEQKAADDDMMPF